MYILKLKYIPVLFLHHIDYQTRQQKSHVTSVLLLLSLSDRIVLLRSGYLNFAHLSFHVWRKSCNKWWRNSGKKRKGFLYPTSKISTMLTLFVLSFLEFSITILT